MAWNKTSIEAVNWYRKAAKQENPNALFNLGTAYFNGDGVGIDDVWAYAWFLLAQKFRQSACFRRGLQPYEGLARQDRTQSGAFERIETRIRMVIDLTAEFNVKQFDWYRKAAEDGGGREQMNLASLLLERQSVDLRTDGERTSMLCEKAVSLKFSHGGLICMGHDCTSRLAGSGIGIFTKATEVKFSDAKQKWVSQ